jgi:release factor glutamine methyltransferase
MHANVLNFEPQNALFVADSDPLIFYRKIAEFAKIYLNENGRLFFEINEHLEKEMCDMLNGLGFREIDLVDDIHGKKRMIFCIKKS